MGLCTARPLVRRRPEHLKAGLAVWRYCDGSCRHVFGTSTGDPVAERLLKELRTSPEGMSRIEISDRFKRHRSTAEIDRALETLSAQGLADQAVRKTAGRPKEIWRFTGEAERQPRLTPHRTCDRIDQTAGERTMKHAASQLHRDHTPRTRIIRIDEVMRRVGLSRSTIWRLERVGGFPKRRQALH